MCGGEKESSRGRTLERARPSDLVGHLEALRASGLGPRSLARQLAAIRGLYRFARATAQDKYRARLTAKVFDALEALGALARQKERPLSHLALKWVLEQKGPTSVLIGPSTLKQLEDNLSGLDLALTPDDMARIDVIVPAGETVSRFYAGDLSPHSHRVTKPKGEQ